MIFSNAHILEGRELVGNYHVAKIARCPISALVNCRVEFFFLLLYSVGEQAKWMRHAGHAGLSIRASG